MSECEQNRTHWFRSGRRCRTADRCIGTPHRRHRTFPRMFPRSDTGYSDISALQCKHSHQFNYSTSLHDQFTPTTQFSLIVRDNNDVDDVISIMTSRRRLLAQQRSWDELN